MKTELTFCPEKQELEDRVDVEIENHGSVNMFRCLTEEAREWVDEHVQVEGWQWLGNGFAVEPRMADGLIDGMCGDGLSVRFGGG